MNVIDWLLEGDPAIRWQVLRDLTNAPADEVAAERARVEHDGWGARLLALEDPDGLWAGGACFPASYTGGEPGQPWTATMHTLQTLQLLGLDPASKSARRAIGLVAENGRWEHDGQRYFDGEVEPCINGRTIETGAYFGVDVAADRRADPRRAARLTAAGTARSRTDRCGPPSTRRSMCSTACSSSSARPAGLRRCARPAAAARSTCSSAACSAARAPASVVRPAYLEFAFPYYWHYDVLRALDYFRRSGANPDPRMAEAVAVVRSKRQPDGRWLLDRIHPGRVYFDLEGGVGTPSRWNTLRALRVLEWWNGIG